MKLIDAPTIELPAGLSPVEHLGWLGYALSGAALLGGGLCLMTFAFANSLSEEHLTPVVLSIGIGISATGLLLLLHAVDRKRTADRKVRLTERYPGQPWTWEFLDCELSVSDGSNERISLKIIATGVLFLASLASDWGLYNFGVSDFTVAAQALSLNVVLVAMIGVCAYQLLVLRKFGTARLEYKRFPFRLAGPFEARLKTVRAFGRFERMELRLSCVREELIESGEHSTIHKNELYRDYIQLKPDVDYDPSRPLNLAMMFELPEVQEAPGTQMGPRLPIYWILTASSKGGGLPFSAHFRVPIYA